MIHFVREEGGSKTSGKSCTIGGWFGYTVCTKFAYDSCCKRGSILSCELFIYTSGGEFKDSTPNWNDNLINLLSGLCTSGEVLESQ